MTILMIRPVGFAYNSETAVNNAFQTAGHAPGIQGQALAEFDHFVDTLRTIDIDILTVEDTPVPQTPDSIFRIIGCPFMKMVQPYFIRCLLRTGGLSASDT